MTNGERLRWPLDCNEDLKGVSSPGEVLHTLLAEGKAKAGSVVTLTWAEKIGDTRIETKGRDDYRVVWGESIHDDANWFVDAMDPDCACGTIGDLIDLALEAMEPKKGEKVTLSFEQYKSGEVRYCLASEHEWYRVAPAAEKKPAKSELQAVA